MLTRGEEDSVVLAGSINEVVSAGLCLSLCPVAGALYMHELAEQCSITAVEEQLARPA